MRKGYQMTEVYGTEMTVFGVSGVAGKVGGEITPEIAVKVGRAIGLRYENVVLCRDVKETGPMIANALAAGLCSVGCDVTDIGICPLPTAVRAIEMGGCSMMVTAPRGASGYSWIRFNNYDGSSFAPHQLTDVHRAVSGDAPVPSASHDSIGMIKAGKRPVDVHIRKIMKDIGSIDCPVIIDCASDSTALVSPMLLTQMGADLTTINSNIHRDLVGRPPEPIEANLRDLIKHVRSEPGAIGIAHDGNGSRVGIIDESGKYVGGNTLVALLASHLKVDSITVPVNTTMAVDEIVKGDVIRTRIGDDYVAEAMKKNRLRFGAEPSGTFVFSGASYCPDGVYAAAVLASIASEGSLRQTISELPYYPICDSDVKFNCDKADLAKRLNERMKSVDCESLITVDGWRVEMDDGWYLIRLSNFENKARITAEARDRVYMHCLVDVARDIIVSCMR
jgi:phosphoglucosamine mutase